MRNSRRVLAAGLGVVAVTTVLVGVSSTVSAAPRSSVSVKPRSHVGAAAEFSAPPAAVRRINGGVEDGTFTPTCLQGAHTVPTGVLDASKYRSAIGADVVRILVPWDIALNQKKSKIYPCFKGYLAAARGKAMIEVSLSRRTDRVDDPDLKSYDNAVEALAKSDGPNIAFLTAYNEPNNSHYLKPQGAAKKAAQFYLDANKHFPGRVVAGDFASGVSKSFFDTYAAGVKSAHPKIWALHPYTDVTDFQYRLAAGQNKDPRSVGSKVGLSSKVVQFARDLKAAGYGSDANIWINEIYVTHRADKNPPKGVSGAKGKTTFTNANQGYAALFVDGGLGTDSLPGTLARAGSGLPQLTRYVYLRATTDNRTLPDADVLKIRTKNCVYYALATKTGALPNQCKKG